jgi:hypothetical protein
VNGKKAKLLRRLAASEMIEDPHRDLVASPQSNTTGINSPNSKRGMYLALKREYGRALRAGAFSPRGAA